MHADTQQAHSALGSLLTSLNLQCPTKDGTLICVPEKKEPCDRERREGGERQGARGSVGE